MGLGNVRAPLARRENPITTPRDRAAKEPRFNPYAAPQTIDRPGKPSELPVAEFAASDGTRQMFPEQPTTVLAAMVRRSKRLQDMQAIWFVIGSFVAVGGFLLAYQQEIGYVVPATCGGTVALIRWYAGLARHRSDRYLVGVMDFLLLATMIGLGIWLFSSCSQGLYSKGGTRLKPTMVEFWVLIIAVPFLLFPGYYSLRSLRALYSGQRLFGPERLKHEDLITELAYRETQGIE